MSLISEALKEAQRERTERAGPRSATAVGEAFFPYATRDSKRAKPRRGFLIGATVVAIVVVGGALAIRLLPTRPAPRVSTATRSVPAPSVVAAPRKDTAVVAPSSSAPAAKPATPTTTPRPSAANASAPANDVGRRDAATRSAPAAIAAPRAVERAEVPQAPKAAKSDSAIAQPPSPAAVTASLPKSSAVRVVMEPASQRPGDSLFARAFAEHSRGNLDAAADLYEKAIARPPVAPELYNDYGALLAARGKHTAAITMYNLGIAASDRDPRLWTNLGDSYRALGRRADAMSAYFEAAKLDPSNVAVKVRLAAEYAAIGDTASARRGFDDAVRIAPRDPEAHYAFGSFLQSQRDYRGATRELQAFIDNAPGRYSQDVIDRTRSYVATLRRQYP